MPHSFLYNYVFSEKTVSGKTIALESGKKFFPEILGQWNSVWNLVQILCHWNFVWNFCFSERIQGSGWCWRREEKREEIWNLGFAEEEEEANMNEEQLQIMSRSWSQRTPPPAVEEEDLARSVQLQAPTRILSVWWWWRSNLFVASNLAVLQLFSWRISWERERERERWFPEFSWADR